MHTEDKITEQAAANTLLLQKGVELQIGKKTFIIRQSFLSTLYKLSSLFLSIPVDEEKLSSEGWLEESKSMYQYAPTLAKIVAVAIINRGMSAYPGSIRWAITRLRIWWLSKYIMNNITPDVLANASNLIIYKMNNLVDFMISIRLMSGVRITAPKKDLSPADNGG